MATKTVRQQQLERAKEKRRLQNQRDELSTRIETFRQQRAEVIQKLKGYTRKR